MSLVRDQAIVLRRLDFSETSQVLAMFTREHGQQRLIAKGIKRPAKGRAATGIDLLELGSIVFSLRAGKEENLAVIAEWRQEDNFGHLRRDLLRCYAAQYAAELTSHFTEVHDPHPNLFDALHNFFAALGEQPPLHVLVQYLWRMLTEIGLRPELGRCMGCGREIDREAILYFSSREGGAICRDCEPSRVEKRRVRGAVAMALASESVDLAACAKDAFDLLDYHLTELMARPPKLSAPLRQAIASAVPKRSH